MKVIKRVIKINWKQSQLAFELANAKAFANGVKRLGQTRSAMNEMLQCSDELRTLLPEIVGLQPTDDGWQDAITEWVKDILIEVPSNGYTLNIGYTVNYGDRRYKAAIDEFIKSNNIAVKDNENIEDVFISYLSKTDAYGNRFVPEYELYKYVKFDDVISYLYYRHCTMVSIVANTVADIDKSPNIMFYLASQEDIDKVRRDNTKVRNQVLKAYTNLLGESNLPKVDAILIAAGQIVSVEDYNVLEDVDKYSRLEAWATANPSIFLAMVDDKNIDAKALVKKYVWYNLFKQLDNGLIVDSYAPDKIIGNTLDECVTFFANMDNKAYLSELKAKYSQIAKS